MNIRSILLSLECRHVIHHEYIYHITIYGVFCVEGWNCMGCCKHKHNGFKLFAMQMTNDEMTKEYILYIYTI